MKELYYSNFTEHLTDGKKAAFYHKLNGNFIIFPSLNAFKSIDDIVVNPEHISDKHAQLVEKLLEQGFLLKSLATKEEEEKLYEDYYVIPNKTTLAAWIGDELELTIPSPSKIQRIKLNKHDGTLWLKLGESKVKFKEVKDEISNLYIMSGYNNCMFKLVPEQKINGNIIFSNLYLSNFYKMDIFRKEHYPSSVYLKLTDICNLNCKMCGQANNRKLGLVRKPNFLNFEQVKKFIEPIIKEVEFVNIWGGEPFMHPEIMEFIKYFSRNKKYISIATNGTYLKKYAKELVDIGVDEIVVSLDGPKDVHENIRGAENLFVDIKFGIEEIVEYKKHMQIKPKMIINCTITEENIDYLYELLTLCKDWKVNKLIYQLPMFVTEKQGEEYSSICNSMWGIIPTSWRGFSKKYALDLNKLYDFYCNVKSNYSDFADFYNIEFDSKDKLNEYFNNPDECFGRSNCIVMNSALVIEANGDLVTCPDFPDIKYENIKNADYQTYFKSTLRREFIQGFKDNNGYPICKRCCQFV
ncbi:radical SAM protein [Acetivibrio clariflavus]|uniref:radical SAM protein n=1 Tax=Acetivibrio clariflavus TaxID=288965 RepID=UPI0031F580F6